MIGRNCRTSRSRNLAAARPSGCFPKRSSISCRCCSMIATPLPGEEPRYAALRELIAAAQKDPKLKAAMIDEAKRADRELVAPLFEFRNYGLPLAHNWTTVDNGATFGTDYFT